MTEFQRPRLVAGRAGLATVAAMLLALAAAPAASAHAVLLKTELGNDAVLEEAPAEVGLRFNEVIETAFGAVPFIGFTLFGFGYLLAGFG